MLPIPHKKFEDFASKRVKVEGFLRDKDLDPKYYLLDDSPEDVAYKDYFFALRNGKVNQEIYYFTDDKKTLLPLSGYNGLLIKAAEALHFSEDRWYFPKEYRTDIDEIVRDSK